MPISYVYNTVFIHIPKCAGTTVEKILGTCTAKDYYSFKLVLRDDVKKTPQHFTYAELHNDFGDSLNDFYKFTIVRNPYSRFVSEYKYRKRMYLNNGREEDNPKDFPAFVEKLKLKEDERILKFDGHLEPQVSFIKNKDGTYEPSIEVFNFENITLCWQMLEKRTGVAFEASLWSMRNVDITPYQKFYTPELAARIYEFYREDFDYFKYNPVL